MALATPLVCLPWLTTQFALAVTVCRIESLATLLFKELIGFVCNGAVHETTVVDSSGIANVSSMCGL